MFFLIVVLILLSCWIVKKNEYLNELTNKINTLDLRINGLSRRLDGLLVQLEENKHKEVMTSQIAMQPQKEVCEDISQDEDCVVDIVIGDAFMNNATKQENETKAVFDDVDEEAKLDKILNETTNKTTQFISKDSFESLFMGNLFGKIGAIVLIIAAMIFIKLSGIQFPPIVKVIASYLASIFMIGFSFKLHNGDDNENVKTFSQILWGIGLSIGFITTYCATSLLNIMPNWLSMLIGGILVIFTMKMSKKFNSLSAIVLGLLGAYLVPFFAREGLTDTFLIAYLIFINLTGIVFVAKNNNKIELCIGNLIFSSVLIAFFSTQTEHSLTIITPILFWLVYFANDFYYNFKGINNKKTDMLNWINLAELVILVNVIYKFEDPALAGIILLFCAAFYFGMYAMFINQKRSIYVYNAITAVIGSTFFLSQDITRICLFGIEAFALSAFALHYNTRYMQRFTLVLAGFVFSGIFTQGEVLLNNTYPSIFNPRMILFVVPALCAFLSALMYKAMQNNKYAGIFSLFSLTLLFSYVIFELNAHNSKNILVTMLLSAVLGFAYSFSSYRLANTFNFPIFKSVSYFIYAISYLTVLITGIINMASTSSEILIPVLNLKFLAYLIAVGLMYYYNKTEKDAIFLYFALFTAALALNGETYTFAHSLSITDGIGIMSSIVLSVYAFVLMFAGILNNHKIFKNFGITLLLIMFAKIIFVDLHQAEPMIKLIAFVLIGLIMLVTSYFYAKKTDD